MIFLDMMSPRGHIQLNRFYLRHILTPADRLIVGKSLGEFYADFSPITFDDNVRIGIRGRLVRARNCLRAVRAMTDNSVCFLSYDLAMMPLISRMLYSSGAYHQVYFEHNTAPSSLVKHFLQKCIPARGTRLVYAPHIGKLFSQAKVKFKTINHPIVLDEPEEDKSELEFILERTRGRQGYVFCPSGTVALGEIEELAERHQHYLFVCKSERGSSLENVLTAPFFQGYRAILRGCSYAYIPFDRADKVSGPLYEAIGLNRSVIARRNLFGCFARSLFPEQVIFEDEFPAAKQTFVEFDVTQYNTEILERIKAVIRS